MLSLLRRPLRLESDILSVGKYIVIVAEVRIFIRGIILGERGRGSKELLTKGVVEWNVGGVHGEMKEREKERESRGFIVNSMGFQTTLNP